MKLTQLATTLLITSAVMGTANTVHATEVTDGQTSVSQESDSNTDDKSGTYWGIGIGSVLGAVIGGPPGAALGATLGGSFGWGQDKDQALEHSLAALEHKEHALTQSETALRRNQSELHRTRQAVTELKRTNVMEAARRVDEMPQEGGGHETAKGQAVLAGLIEHYAQEVYFRKGEAKVPDYAKSRLENLSELLKSNGELKVTLTGYTDQQGPTEFNDALAQARAEGIREVLLEQGIDTRRVSVVSVGEAKSSAQPGDAGNYILDRRVSIELGVNAPTSFPVASLQEVTQ